MATRTPGSEARAGETDHRKRWHRAPARPYWYVLEGAGFELLLVNARHVKQVPGRKTDVSDSAWIARLVEQGLVRPSFVRPARSATCAN